MFPISFWSISTHSHSVSASPSVIPPHPVQRRASESLDSWTNAFWRFLLSPWRKSRRNSNFVPISTRDDFSRRTIEQIRFCKDSFLCQTKREGGTFIANSSAVVKKQKGFKSPFHWRRWGEGNLVWRDDNCRDLRTIYKSEPSLEHKLDPSWPCPSVCISLAFVIPPLKAPSPAFPQGH